ncbi:DUF397 domain-containing protein [Nocardiopsis dassonvillei]|uniref:DUF397 domain-containing protein n=1 Tax=Nocardiopsis dassonvillei TaxID=2014 RepID=UPI003F573922
MARVPGGAAIRDSGRPDGTVLVFGARTWHALLQALRAGPPGPAGLPGSGPGRPGAGGRPHTERGRRTVSAAPAVPRDREVSRRSRSASTPRRR